MWCLGFDTTPSAPGLVMCRELGAEGEDGTGCFCITSGFHQWHKWDLTGTPFFLIHSHSLMS